MKDITKITVVVSPYKSEIKVSQFEAIETPKLYKSLSRQIKKSDMDIVQRSKLGISFCRVVYFIYCFPENEKQARQKLMDVVKRTISEIETSVSEMKTNFEKL